MKGNGLDKKRKFEAAAAHARASRARREQMAAEFRALLLAELGGRKLLAHEEALVEICTGTYVTVCELHQRFFKGRTSDRDFVQLGLATGRLTRTLVALGVTCPVGTDGDGVPGGSQPKTAQDTDGGAVPGGSQPRSPEVWADDQKQPENAPTGVPSGGGV